MADTTVKGPASYFPAIEQKYGKPIAEWQALIRARLPAKHMELVAMLKQEHGMGHGHANALVAATDSGRGPELMRSAGRMVNWLITKVW